MINVKFFSVLVVFLMVFASAGSASAAAISDNVRDNITNDSKFVKDSNNVIVVDNPINKEEILKAIDAANNGDTILIKGSISDSGTIKSNKILHIKGENCNFNKIHWVSNCDISFENIGFKNSHDDYKYGGAIYCEGSVNITNCNFANNSANKEGGAIWAIDKVNVCESNFTGNVADYGGAVYSENSICNTQRSLFKDNVAKDKCGGAICCNPNYYQIVSIVDSKFEHNIGDTKGGAIYTTGAIHINCSSFVNNYINVVTCVLDYGGAIYSDDWVDVSNSNFTDNYADDYGGAIYATNQVKVENCLFDHTYEWDASNNGGAIYSDKGYVKLSNSKFIYNIAFHYGGAVWSEGDVNIDNCLFDNNHAKAWSGGAIYSKGVVNIHGSNFTNNNAGEDGGAINSKKGVNVVDSYFEGNVAELNPLYQCEGGSICCDSGSVILTNSKFINNYAEDYGGAVWSDDDVTVNNCLFKNNSVDDNQGGAIYMDDSFDLKISNSAFYGNHANDKGGAIYCEGNNAHVYLESFNSFENNSAKEGKVVFTDGYFESIWQNWWGTMKPNWDSGLLVEWKAIGPNKKHEDSRPLAYNPNL